MFKSVLIKASIAGMSIYALHPAHAMAQTSEDAFNDNFRLKPRVEVNARTGNFRSLSMTEIWLPLLQSAYNQSVIYGDIRFMNDSNGNSEGNIGLGYRKVTSNLMLGKGVFGLHTWLDHRLTEFGTPTKQLTIGAEWLGEDFDLLFNAYQPLTQERVHLSANLDTSTKLIGNSIYVNTPGKFIEESQEGFDFEVGRNLNFLDNYISNGHTYLGAYYFDGDNSDPMTGWRTRFNADITPDVTLGARFQQDNIRGYQGVFEATFRFPFGYKKAYKKNDLRTRLDESPERDIDIITGTKVLDNGKDIPLTNATTGETIKVYYVNNAATPNGDGSAENPFDNLTDAANAAGENDIIYVNYGTGNSTRQNSGITLNKAGQSLIGSGEAFIYNGSLFSTANGLTPNASKLIAATSSPVITNTSGHGVTIAADNVKVSGITIDGATGSGIFIEADGSSSSVQNAEISNVISKNNKHGIYIHATNSGKASVKVENSVTTNNSQHGIVVYDDTDKTFEVDLGGGSFNSSGNNVLKDNTLEDLAVDYDGRALFAKNNWWGQSTGPDQDAPNIGIRPQIYYGAPINDDLLASWTFDTEWMSNTIAYNRASTSNNATLEGSLSLSDISTGQHGEAISFNHATLDQLNAGNIGDINGATELTFTTWMKLSSTGINKDNDIWTKGTHNANQPFLIWRDEVSSSGNQSGNVNTISVFVSDSSDVSWISAPNNSYNDTNWHHVAVTFKANDSTGLKIYIDGALQQSGSTTNVDYVYTNGSSVRVGQPSDNKNGVNGYLDDNSIYTRALSSNEIAEMYRMNTSSTINTGAYLTSAP